MYKKQYVLLHTEGKMHSPTITKEFEYQLQQAVLLSLLERRQLTLWQYEQCLDILRNII